MREAVAPGAARALPWVAAGVAAVTVGVGLYVRRATDTPLGVPYPPALGDWSPQADPLLVVAIACFAAAVLVSPRLLSVPRWAFAGAMVSCRGRRLARIPPARAPRGGARVRPCALLESKKSTCPPGRADTLRLLPRRFAELSPRSPCTRRPPAGMLLTLPCSASIPGRDGGAVPRRRIQRPAGVRRRAPVLYERLAAAAPVALPPALLFGAPSADASPPARLCRLAAARELPSLAAGAVLLAFGSFFAWSLLAVGSWAALVRTGR